MKKLNINYLQNKIKDKIIKIEDTCTSTQLILQNTISSFDYILISKEQTNGIGTKKHIFESPKDKGLYFSYLKKMPIDLTYTFVLTPLIAVALKRALEHYLDNVKIKWINDIYIDNKKIAGILVNTKSTNTITDNIIIGIGINLYYTTYSFLKAASIEELTNKIIPINELLVLIIENIDLLLQNYKDLDFIDEYKHSSNIIGKNILIKQNNIIQEAYVIDITDDMKLKVIINNKEYILDNIEIISNDF